MTMQTIKPRANQTICVSEKRSRPNCCTTMSRVNIVPTATNWESSDDMMAARTPAATSPEMTGVVSLPTINPRTALALAPAGITVVSVPGMIAPVAQKPISTHGTQVRIMHIGWPTRSSLKVLADRAVRKFWKRCGNIAAESGIKPYEKNCSSVMFPSRTAFAGFASCEADSIPPNFTAINQKASRPIAMKTRV